MSEYIYWASTQANPDKPKVAFVPIVTFDELRRRARAETHCAAMRTALGRKLVPVDLPPDAFKK